MGKGPEKMVQSVSMPEMQAKGLGFCSGTHGKMPGVLARVWTQHRERELQEDTAGAGV